MAYFVLRAAILKNLFIKGTGSCGLGVKNVEAKSWKYGL